MGRRIMYTLLLTAAAAFLFAGCGEMALLQDIRGRVEGPDGTAGDGDTTVPVTGVSLDKESITIPAGATEQLTAAVEPADATDQSVTWSSDNDSVAAVDADGLVTGAAGGTATVTVTTTDGGFTASCSVTVYYPPGYKETYTADGVSFDLAYVPGGLTFPTGTDDDGNATVDDAYWIADTEVTYELWYAVHAWATDNGYTFANDGREGHDGPDGADQEPVTYISWRDSIVWCNALTEWYNAEKGTSYECVYTYSGSIIRDSTNSNCDDADESTTAKGFRLLSSNEYECAARYRDGTLWTYGDHASGDDSGACYNDGDILGGLGMSTVFGDYAWYDSNSGSSTHVVGTAGNDGGAARTGNSNALGLYDMSGNVREWCFTKDGSLRIYRGGSWINYADNLQVGYWFSNYPDSTHSSLGFRVCRTAD